MGIKGMKREEFEDNESLDLLNESGTNILLTTIDDVINWGGRTHYGHLLLPPVAVVLK